MKINQAMVESYLRNLLGQVLAAITIVTGTTHVAVVNFGSEQWGLVANTLWGALVPVAIRYFKKNDPAFGIVADQVAALATDAVAKKTTKKASK